MKITVVEPHGFCAGVTAALRKALEVAAQAQDFSTADDRQPTAGELRPVYCLHQLVHNEIVVGDLKKRGFVFVESADEVPEGATVLFSAHGVSPAVRKKAEERRLKVVDATCPFVGKVHKAARDFAARGLPVVVIGNPSHAEVQGIVGEVERIKNVECRIKNGGVGQSCASLNGRGERPARPLSEAQKTTNTTILNSKFLILNSELNLPHSFGLVSQTTMNADEVKEIVERLKEKYDVETMAEVCNATKVRQDAVKAFAGDALLVLGSANSSNTKRLCEVARCRTFRAGTMDEVKALDLSGIEELGVTSGASTPESFFSDAVAWLKGRKEAGK